jgi:hypothetical protein
VQKLEFDRQSRFLWDKRSGNRLNLYLTTGFTRLVYDQANYTNAAGLRISGSQTGNSVPGLPAGWLKYNTRGSSLIRYIIINLAGNPVEFH